MAVMALAPSRSRGTSKLPREQREQQILDAAAEEFGAAGYAGASLARVAERVGVSKALVLSYFGSKESLYVATVERAGADLAGRIEPVITTPQPAGAMALATLEAIFVGLEARQHDWNVINDRTVPPGGPAAEASRRARRAIAAQASRGVAALERLGSLGGPGALADADDLAVLTDVWMGAVTSVVNWWLRHPERSAAEMTGRCARILRVLGDS